MWMAKEHLDLIIPSKRGKSVTVIGGLSNKVGMLHYEVLTESNTKETFLDFIIKLIEKVKDHQATSWWTI
jgi:cation transport ATPase